MGGRQPVVEANNGADSVVQEAIVPLAEAELALPLFGTRDQHLQMLRQQLGVSIIHRDGKIHVRGEEAPVTQATTALERMKDMLIRRGRLLPDDVAAILARLRGQTAAGEQAIEVFNTARRIVPRTPGQAEYVRTVRQHDVTLATGPAGTGKTYLAVALAVEALRNRAIRKIVLVRPAVEAGESLGFLPGDLQAKINPYLRPLLDALHEMIDHDQIKRSMEQDVIEVIPLAYMRGRTLNEAFIILDEAQNTTVSQMKMFLTRMGADSKVVVSGDTTQVDLPSNTRSGLVDAVTRLRSIEGIGRATLTETDIVRHRLVQDIVRAYETPARGDSGRDDTSRADSGRGDSGRGDGRRRSRR